MTRNGLVGDRCWAVRDEKLGGIRGAKRFPALMDCEARYLAEPLIDQSTPVEITLPNGRRITTNDDNVGTALSEYLANPVTFWPLVDAAKTEHYKRGAPLKADVEEELRRVFARDQGEPLPDISGFPEELLEYESLPGTYFDALPLLLMTSKSLSTLQKSHPESIFDVRRFRPNILLSTDADDAFPELDYIGKSIKIGSAILSVELACPRCVMTTHGFSDLPKDPKIMRTLVKESDGNLGVYATVRHPGRVSIGDALEIVS